MSSPHVSYVTLPCSVSPHHPKCLSKEYSRYVQEDWYFNSKHCHYKTDMHTALILVLLPHLFITKAITSGFFADFPPPVKGAAEAIVNARSANVHGHDTHVVVWITLVNAHSFSYSFIHHIPSSSLPPSLPPPSLFLSLPVWRFICVWALTFYPLPPSHTTSSISGISPSAYRVSVQYAAGHDFTAI